MNPTRYIYCLCEPDGKTVRYVGQSKCPQSRYKYHLIDDSKTHKVHWIQALLREGKSPKLKILEIILKCSEAQWKIAERKWIRKFSEDGNRLTNSDPGGIGTTLSEDTRRRIGEKLKGHLVTAATRLKLSKHKPSLKSRLKMSRSQKKRFKSWKFSPEAIGKIKEAASRKTISEDGRRRISEYMKNRIVSPSTRRKMSWNAKHRSLETRLKLSIANRGRKLTDEHRRKCSEALKGHQVSMKTRAKIRKALTGAKFTPERCKNISAGHERRRRGWLCEVGQWNVPMR